MVEKTANQIIMNYMPPALTLTPSPAFSILKGFISQHGYSSRVIYWNRLIYHLVSSALRDLNPATQMTDMDIQFLTPFLFELSGKFKDPVVQKRILSFLRGTSPRSELKRKFYREIIESMNEEIFHLIDSELEKIDAGTVLLFGFSSKFYQWIPGILLAEKFKRKFPGVKIVIGGFLDKETARDILFTCSDFDFAVWGEGEYPLLELCNQLREGAIDFESVPRLVYRDRENVKVTKSQSKYLSFQNYVFPDFSDFIGMPDTKEILSHCMFPIESSRSCYWGRCKFCSFNMGYKYRRRSPENVVQEIEHLFKEYKITKFRFVDNDIVGKDKARLEEQLDMIIESSLKSHVKYSFYAEIIHHDFNSRLIEKLSVAGFNQVQIGYEAITDGLLKKMDKMADFADHILFLKFAIKYGISVIGCNIIRGIVGETEDDVQESAHNLVFLRFFLSGNPGKFCHIPIELRFQGGTRFLKMLDSEERKKCKYSPFGYLLPHSLIGYKRRFNLLGFTWDLENKVEWELFGKANKFYEDTEITYRILKNKGVYYYSEFNKGELINYIVFNEPEYWEVLKVANDGVSSFEKIFGQLKEKFPAVTEKYLVEIIEKLKSHYLIYANTDLTRIISIIDVGDIE